MAAAVSQASPSVVVVEPQGGGGERAAGIVLRADGEFYQAMELENFPFDMQELSIELALNCRTNFSRAAFFTMTRMHSTKELEPLTKTLEPKCKCKSVAAWFFLATL